MAVRSSRPVWAPANQSSREVARAREIALENKRDHVDGTVAGLDRNNPDRFPHREWRALLGRPVEDTEYRNRLVRAHRISRRLEREPAQILLCQRRFIFDLELNAYLPKREIGPPAARLRLDLQFDANFGIAAQMLSDASFERGFVDGFGEAIILHRLADEIGERLGKPQRNAGLALGDARLGAEGITQHDERRSSSEG